LRKIFEPTLTGPMTVDVAFGSSWTKKPRIAWRGPGDERMVWVPQHLTLPRIFSQTWRREGK